MNDKGGVRPMCSLLYSMMANCYDLFVGDQRRKMVGYCWTTICSTEC